MEPTSLISNAFDKPVENKLNVETKELSIDHDYAIGVAVPDNLVSSTATETVITEPKLKKKKKKKQKKKIKIEPERKPVSHLHSQFFAGYVPFRKTKEELVQIKAGKEQVLRRISCFQAHKRFDMDRSNISEFCHPTHKVKGERCARVDSVVMKRDDCKSHIKVYRVFNKWGPQTRGVDPGSIPHPDPPDPYMRLKREREEAMKEKFCGQCGNSLSNECPYSLDERLETAEIHLQIDGPVPLDIHARVRQIEDRILNLEGISPEYADNKPEVKSRGWLPDFSPLNKRAYSQYELKRRLKLLQNRKIPSCRKKEELSRRQISKKIHKKKKKKSLL